MRITRGDWNRSGKTLLLTLFLLLLTMPTWVLSQEDRTVSTKNQRDSAANEGTKDDGNAPATADNQKAKYSEPILPGLEEMLATALDNHPDVRAAEARLRTAQADLDRTRLDVVQKIIEFRQKWYAEKARVTSAQHALERAEELNKQGISPAGTLEAAQERVTLLRAELTGFESQLPLLIGGKLRDRTTSQTTTAEIRAQAENMLAAAERALELTMQAYRAGNAGFGDVYQWSRRMIEAERLTNPPQAQQVAGIEAHRTRMQSLLDAAETRYKLAEAQATDVLAVKFYVAEAELWLSQAKAK